jgi:hypothetical protein
MGCIAITGERGIAWVVVGGTELLVTQQIIKNFNPGLCRFRPEPGFYRIGKFNRVIPKGIHNTPNRVSI